MAADTTTSPRELIILCNDSDETIYLGIGATAVMNKGTRLNSNGGTYIASYPDIPLCAINAICASGNKNLTVNTGE